jgi:putative SOS response-associated peptidase YedK
MCGRYGRFSRKERIEGVLGRPSWAATSSPRATTSVPGLPDWIIRQSYRTRELRFEQFLWGLLPSWTKNPKSARRPINARAETVAERPMFRDLLSHRRCVVPIDGYYEWRTTSSGQGAVLVQPEERRAVLPRGLWDRWHGGKPDALASYILMTTEPNALAAKVHDRMPCCFTPATCRAGSIRRSPRRSRVSDLLGPYPAGGMEMRPGLEAREQPDNEGPGADSAGRLDPELWT